MRADIRSSWLLLSACLSACSGRDGGATGGGVHGGDAGGTGGARGALPEAGPSCPGPGFASGAPGLAFAHLSATVTDLTGAPAVKVPAQACGVNVCLNGTTDPSGSVVIDETATLVEPAFKYGGGLHYAKFALPLRGSAPLTLDLGGVTTVAFDPPASGATVVPGTPATSNGVTLLLPANGTLHADPFDFPPDLRTFRAAAIPLAALPRAVDPTLGFVIVVALTPSGATLCPSAKLRVPNTASLAAKSRVEFLVHGTEVAEEFAPYGGFAKVSEGFVSDDGTTVETDDSGGLPILSVVGIRPAQ